MEKLVFKIEGMTCTHCTMAVEKALKRVEGVTKAWVDLESAQAAVEGTGLDVHDLIAAVEAAGYHAELMDEA